MTQIWYDYLLTHSTVYRCFELVSVRVAYTGSPHGPDGRACPPHDSWRRRSWCKAGASVRKLATDHRSEFFHATQKKFNPPHYRSYRSQEDCILPLG